MRCLQMMVGVSLVANRESGGYAVNRRRRFRYAVLLEMDRRSEIDDPVGRPLGLSSSDRR